MKNSSQNVASHDDSLSKQGVKIKISEVTKINHERKICLTNDGLEIAFDRLVLATGSVPIIPDKIEGVGNDRVFIIPKNKDYLDQMLGKVHQYNNITIIGGGSTGIEIADELSKTGKNITIIESQPHILNTIFDQELITPLEKQLLANNIRLKSGSKVTKIIEKGNSLNIKLASEEQINSDAVILAAGYRPQTALAHQAGISLNKDGFIEVDEYFKTSIPDIYAIGDCAEKTNFITGKADNTMLASTACTEARILGKNLFNLKQIKTFSGTLPIFLTVVGNTGFGAAGLSEKQANSEGIKVITGIARGIDRHPGSFDSTHQQLVKLIADQKTGLILGGGVIGNSSAGELLNVIGLAIQNQMSAHSLFAMQLGTHPLLTGSPGDYTIIKAAEAIVNNL